MRFFSPSVFAMCAAGLQAAVVFEDGFEAPALADAWTIDTTNAGRVAIGTEHGPATGQRHLLLDDSLSDAIYSVAEAVLRLDLTHKKNVVLSFKAKSLGNEPDAPPLAVPLETRAFDGVSISLDRGATWRAVQSLASVGSTWEQLSVSLDGTVNALGGAYGQDFRIRFSEYDNGPAPVDGIAIDDVLVTAGEDQRAVVELPSLVVEGSAPATGYVVLAFAPVAPVTLELTASVADLVTLPATVTVPAGEIGVSFRFSVLEDDLVNLSRTVAINAMAPGVLSTAGILVIQDNEVFAVSLTLPAQLAEGTTPSSNATVSIDKVPSVPVMFDLSATPSWELTVPARVTIAAGQKQVSFTVRAVDDPRIDGDTMVSVTATNAPGVSGAAQTTVTDNEARTLTLALPAALAEKTSGAANLKIPGILPADLKVTLMNSDETALSVPTSVAIPAGMTQVSFSVVALDNSRREGSRTVTIEASAPTFPTTSKQIVIRDDDPASYRFDPVGDIVNVSSPLTVTITPVDVQENAIVGFAGAVSLSVVLPDGTTQAVTPPTATLTNGSWTGSVTLPALTAPPLRVRATDASGLTGETNAFDIMRTLPLRTSDLVWDGSRNRIYASVTTPVIGTTIINSIVAIDPATLQITADVSTGDPPDKLALTDGGEFLYASVNNTRSNGARIAKIDLSTFTVASTFDLRNAFSEPMLAEDISTVAGQPNLLVVSHFRTFSSPSHNGVAVYDNGVRRPNITPEIGASNVIERSADPTIFFGYNNETTPFGLSRMRLDANGMTQIEVVEQPFTFPAVDFRSQGNMIFSNAGDLVDGTLMRRQGRFALGIGLGGLACPDLSANRVYILEQWSVGSSSYDRISAFDPATFALIRQLKLPSRAMQGGAFIRWGPNGLAFKSGTTAILIHSSQLVPSDPPADLATSVRANPNPATTSEPLTYTITATNQGPSTASDVLLTVTLSEPIQNVVASRGAATVAGTTLTAAIGDLAANASETLSVTMVPRSGSIATCTAKATANSIDLNFTNNVASLLVVSNFRSVPDRVTPVFLGLNNLIYDNRRGLLWGTLPGNPPFGPSVLSLNPVTGQLSAPMPIGADPIGNSIALSANGRYLYVGLSSVPEIHRIDLEAALLVSARIPLGHDNLGRPRNAGDIEVLEGDGTSILVALREQHLPAVYDGLIERTSSPEIYPVDRIEPSSTPGVFIGLNTWTSGRTLWKLSVTPTGVSMTQEVRDLVAGPSSTDIRGAGNRVLASTGQLFDSGTLAVVTTLGFQGRPCLDLMNQRAYLVRGPELRGFDITSAASFGFLPLPVTDSTDWAAVCVRWGLDGFAILGRNDPTVYIARWSQAIPAEADLNANHLPDAWEAANLGGLGGDLRIDADGDGIPSGLEYVYGTLPAASTADPRQITLGESGLIRLVFPRRAGLPPGFYGYASTSDLRTWTPALGVIETVLETQSVEGIQIETVEALIPSPDPGSGFVHLVWPH